MEKPRHDALSIQRFEGFIFEISSHGQKTTCSTNLGKIHRKTKSEGNGIRGEPDQKHGEEILITIVEGGSHRVRAILCLLVPFS